MTEREPWLRTPLPITLMDRKVHASSGVFAFVATEDPAGTSKEKRYYNDNVAGVIERG